MRLFVHEYLTGGGVWSEGPAHGPTGSLLVEGQAMRRALIDDLARIPGVELELSRDNRLPWTAVEPGRCHVVSSVEDERALFCELATQVDGVILVAPEIDGALVERVMCLERLGAKLQSPNAAFTRIAADKQLACARLSAAGVPVPYGGTLADDATLPVGFPYPAVLKPQDGAGSRGVQFVVRATDVVDRGDCRVWRLERFQPGQAASVAVLMGPAGAVCLPALVQRLGGSSGFEYLGGAGPLPGAMNARACRLAQAAIAALPAAVGYVGVDLVLGAAEDGGQDVVIEINPRLTTSYVGLSAWSLDNLALAMLDVAAGRPRDVRFRVGRLEFDASGATTIHPTRDFEDKANA